MANVVVNRWHVVICISLVMSLAVLFYYSYFWKPVEVNREILYKPYEHEQHSYLSWNGTGKGIFYREVLPSTPRFSVLLLHGTRSSSIDWHYSETLKALGSKGYRAIAVDLPQHGKSETVKAPSEDDGRIQFLDKLIKKLGLERPVLVAPSMSSSYAMPFVMNKKHSKELRCFIPLTPDAVANYTDDELKALDLPTLLVYCEKDVNFHQYVAKMKNIPNSEVFVMKPMQYKDPSFPCYLDNPGEFHASVVKFLNKLV